MAFADGIKQSDYTRRTSKYVKIVTGIPSVVQILDEKPVVIGKHWLVDSTGRRIGLRCPGMEVCPSCARNRALGYNKNHKDFIPLRRRYRVNVLDLTPSVVCPGCEAVYPGKVSGKCTIDGCSEDLSSIEPAPLSEVRILERGVTLMTQIGALESIPHPLTGKEESLRSYPIMLIATGAGRDMVITAIPQAPNDVDPAGYEKFDLLDDLILTPDEIQHLLEGTAYNDILAARRADAEAEVKSEVSEPSEIPF